MENTTQPDTIPQFEAISVYPNPVADWLTIELPRSDTYYTIRLTDLRGAQIFAEMTRDFNSSSYRVNLKGLGEGLYLLTVVRPGIQPVTTKIIRRN
ncbi:MAG TPA: T9SS type A sorting domain-containing protein [Prolixibacteraceae bacterium]|nr:T9SS type A sorting domain-containing protein [Prolixibacteraceae bacterium]